GTQVKGALTADFATFFQNLASGTKTVGQAFAELGISVVQSLEQIVAQMLATIAVEKILSALGSLFGIKAPGAADTSKPREVGGANTAQAESDVFVQAIEAVPFPANLAVAPATAAVVGAEMGAITGAAFAVGGSAAGGAVLDRDMIIQAHAQEMILPKDISL